MTSILPAMNLKRHLPFLALLLAGLATSCSSDPAANPETDSVLLPVIPMTGLKDGDFTLRVEARLATTEGIQFPHDPIPSAGYEPAKGEVLLIRFSENGLRVALPDKKITGVVDVSGSTKRVYSLSDGLFAGGSLTIEKSSQGLVATFTVFGSGEPVLSSKRGPLIPKTIP